MQIQVNAHHSLTGSARLHSWASQELEQALDRFRTRLSRVEVYLSDENQEKEGNNDKRCSIEAKMDGFPVMAAVHHADTVADALFGATEKLGKILDKKLSKIQHHKGQTPTGGEPFADMSASDADDDDDVDVDLDYDTDARV